MVRPPSVPLHKRPAAARVAAGKGSRSPWIPSPQQGSKLSSATIKVIMGSQAPLATADICDANSDLLMSGALRPLPPIFKVYGKHTVFSGPVVTVKVLEDNILVHEFIKQKGDGRVLVVDGCGSLRNALVGGNLAKRAENNGWAGIVVYGCVRDVDDINRCEIGVRALSSYPVRPAKKGNGEKHITVTIAGTRVCDGDWLYADADGILVSATELAI